MGEAKSRSEEKMEQVVCQPSGEEKRNPNRNTAHQNPPRRMARDGTKGRGDKKGKREVAKQAGEEDLKKKANEKKSPVRTTQDISSTQRQTLQRKRRHQRKGFLKRDACRNWTPSRRSHNRAAATSSHRSRRSSSSSTSSSSMTRSLPRRRKSKKKGRNKDKKRRRVKRRRRVVLKSKEAQRTSQTAFSGQLRHAMSKAATRPGAQKDLTPTSLPIQPLLPLHPRAQQATSSSQMIPPAALRQNLLLPQLPVVTSNAAELILVVRDIGACGSASTIRRPQKAQAADTSTRTRPEPASEVARNKSSASCQPWQQDKKTLCF